MFITLFPYLFLYPCYHRTFLL